MKKIISIALILLFSAPTFAIVRVSFDELQQGGWQQYNGQYVQITTPLIVCATFYDSIYLAPERLFVPEEKAIGLADGDSTTFFQWAEHNTSIRIKLECNKPYNLNLGATVTSLKAQITGNRTLTTGSRPNFRNYKPKKALPQLGNAQLTICSANIQNYFVHQGGYATKRNTMGQHALQCYKVAAALCKMDADLYAICELEKGNSAPQELANKMNELARKDKYDYVRTPISDGDTIAVGFIYNKLTLAPFGQLLYAYPDTNSIYHNRFVLQGFEQLSTKEQFVVSLNHLRSKRGSPEESVQKRLNNSEALLQLIKQAYSDSLYTDPDIILLGDFNSYTYELPLQTIVRAGYQDVLMQHDSTNYSYSYRGECGYLDRVYASPSMAEQITAIHPLHWNTDFYYSAAYYSKYNFKKRIVPKDAPANIRKTMSRAAKKNLLFRYSDHDPILIGLQLKSNNR